MALKSVFNISVAYFFLFFIHTCSCREFLTNCRAFSTFVNSVGTALRPQRNLGAGARFSLSSSSLLSMMFVLSNNDFTGLALNSLRPHRSLGAGARLSLSLYHLLFSISSFGMG